MVREVLSVSRKEGVEVEWIRLAGKKIHPCEGRGSCLKTGKCRIKDDVQEMLEKMRLSDGILFGSPVYFWNITAQAKIIIDRTLGLLVTRQLRGKVGGAVIVARRAGAANAF